MSCSEKQNRQPELGSPARAAFTGAVSNSLAGLGSNFTFATSSGMSIYFGVRPAQNVIGFAMPPAQRPADKRCEAFRQQEHRFAGIQFDHIRNKGEKSPLSSGYLLKSLLDRLPRFALLAVKRRFEYAYLRDFFFALHIQQAGEKLAQTFSVRRLQKWAIAECAPATGCSKERQCQKICGTRSSP